jgi:thymidylate kinase
VAGTAATLTRDPSNSSHIERVAELRVRLASMSPDEVAAMLAARRAAGEHERR